MTTAAKAAKRPAEDDITLTKRDVGPPVYRVVSVDRIKAPEGTEETAWCEYVIDDTRSAIKGQRPGTVKQVTAYARQFAEELNTRAKAGYRSTWAPRGRPKKQPPTPT